MEIDPLLCEATLVNGYLFAPWIVRPCPFSTAFSINQSTAQLSQNPWQSKHNHTRKKPLWTQNTMPKSNGNLSRSNNGARKRQMMKMMNQRRNKNYCFNCFSSNQIITGSILMVFIGYGP